MWTNLTGLFTWYLCSLEILSGSKNVKIDLFQEQPQQIDPKSFARFTEFLEFTEFPFHSEETTHPLLATSDVLTCSLSKPTPIEAVDHKTLTVSTRTGGTDGTEDDEKETETMAMLDFRTVLETKWAESTFRIVSM